MPLRTASSRIQFRGAVRSLLKFSAFTALTVGVAYESLHLYVEHIQLAPDSSDSELRKWGWAERWTGDPQRGGTDPALGLRGRHLVRAAWMASNWGVGRSTAFVESSTDTTEGLPGPGGSRVIDAALHRTDEFLRSAIEVAEKKAASGALSSSTLNTLLLHHASVLERLEDSLPGTSKSQYERAWAISPEAHVAWKLGDLNSRLGRTNDALAWWSRVILLACGKNSDGRELVPVVPSIAPSSPQDQRTLTSALVSLSAFYATSGQFKKAQQVQESALDLIPSPAQSLHALYLLHRSSLLSIHLAEVLYAQKKHSLTSMQWLTSAAESSERVAYALTGLPLRYLPTASLASTLLRDASRTAAEAWHLIGVLHEINEGPTSGQALKCYERAVGWAGKTVPQSDAKVAGDGTLEAEWNMIWSSYNRLRQRASREK
ncbi:hypothetical protein F5887DRAFT_1058742 [Amanita rubescens]|nr:hypothetical protein F5887DRAFT_1058742 [Amanita rubescens]